MIYAEGCVLIIAEASLELVPKELQNHHAVKSHAARLGRKPSDMFLDKSYHYAALKDNRAYFSKHGRPDITHHTLMAALATPLYLNNQIKVCVSTIDNNSILIGERVRFPKSYSRFDGLMADLYKRKRIRNRKGEILLELKEGVSFSQLIDNLIKPRQVIGFSTNGFVTTLEKVVSSALSLDPLSCAFIVGGFPKGHFSESTTSKLTGLYNISRIGLEAHVVVARLIYECEKVLNG